MLRFLGGVFLVLLLAAAGLVGGGFWLDRQARPAAARHMELLFTQWRYDDLDFLASDSFHADAKAQAAVKELLPLLQRDLGPLRRLGEVRGTAGFAWGDTPKGQGIVGNYQAEAEFEKGKARVRLNLVRERGVWRVRGFWIDQAPAQGAPTIKA